MKNKRMWNLLKEWINQDIETYNDYAEIHQENGEFVKADSYYKKVSELEKILDEMKEIEKM